MKAFQALAIGIFVGAVGFIAYSLAKDSGRKYYAVTHPEPSTIDNRLYLFGFVYPSKEIEIKPQMSGVVDEIYVSVGDAVVEGAPIASISLVPNSSEIESLTSAVRMATINLNTTKANYEREKYLYEKNVVPRSEYEQAEKEFLSAQENLSSAENQLGLRQKGKNSGSNIVRASTSGTVIDLPVKPGSSVVERSSYNVGSTIAIISSSGRYVFKANVPERNIKDLQVGDEAMLRLLAYDSLMIRSSITMISAKGEMTGGAVRFPIEAEFSVSQDEIELRSGYSATAEIILSAHEVALSLPEKCISFKGDTTYVYLSDSLGRFAQERRITIGLSDEERIEVIEGITKDDYVITNYHD